LFKNELKNNRWSGNDKIIKNGFVKLILKGFKRVSLYKPVFAIKKEKIKFFSFLVSIVKKYF